MDSYEKAYRSAHQGPGGRKIIEMVRDRVARRGGQNIEWNDFDQVIDLISRETKYWRCADEMLREPGGLLMCRQVRDRLAAQDHRDACEDMRLKVLTQVLVVVPDGVVDHDGHDWVVKKVPETRACGYCSYEGPWSDGWECPACGGV